ncbi:MAG: hypothetical protein WA416_15700 [Candidatus Sulfotelmatobacter sp.]
MRTPPAPGWFLQPPAPSIIYEVSPLLTHGSNDPFHSVEQEVTQEKSMNKGSRWFRAKAAVIFSATVFFGIYAFAAGKQTFTGEVGDAMCGRQHMEGTAAECTRACVAKGSKFALVVGDKIYILDTTDKAALATLDKQAGKNATVTGTLDGDTISVSSVAAK